jgi:hypothetical protein
MTVALLFKGDQLKKALLHVIYAFCVVFLLSICTDVILEGGVSSLTFSLSFIQALDRASVGVCTIVPSLWLLPAYDKLGLRTTTK